MSGIKEKGGSREKKGWKNGKVRRASNDKRTSWANENNERLGERG